MALKNVQKNILLTKNYKRNMDDSIAIQNKEKNREYNFTYSTVKRQSNLLKIK